MIGPDGPSLIEYNVRFGDPETQAMLPRLREDFLALLLASVDGTMQARSLRFSDEFSLTLVMAAAGYPGTPRRGGAISGLDALDSVIVTQAGTALVDGRLVADGGRVLNLTALSGSVAYCRDLVYAAAKRVEWADGFYRRDIGAKALA